MKEREQTRCSSNTRPRPKAYKSRIRILQHSRLRCEFQAHLINGPANGCPARAERFTPVSRIYSGDPKAFN